MNPDNQIRIVEDSEKEAFISNIKKIDWRYWVNRPYSVFMATLFWEGVREEVFERNGFKNFGPGNNFYQFPDLYYDSKFVENGKTFFDSYFKSHKMSDLSKDLEQLHARDISEFKKTLSDNSLTVPEKLRVFSNLIQDYVPAIWAIANLEEYFNRRIATEVPKYIEGDYSKFVGDISLPDKKNVYVLMTDDIKSGVSNKDIVEKYGWMKSRDGFTDFYTEEEIEEIRNGIKDQEPHTVDIPDELLELSGELKELNYFRTARTDKFYEFFGVARPFMKEVAKFIGVEFKDLAFYDVNSIILGQPKTYNKDFCYGLLANRYFIGNEKIMDFSEHDNKEVKGRTAFKGLVKGIAKIVTHPNDIGKVQEGDILVAQMTFPSFISAMQKAVAFVTDEGSITCHAAIIAREMRKACIVGTKNGTKILKDGDLVEVDADNGVVRIIDKKA